MTERRIEGDNTNKSASGILDAVEIETREQKKRRRAEVYDRGIVGSRLHVELPPELHGEWVPNVPEEIHRKENLGFQIDTEYARQRRLHDKGDSASYVGDVVFMTCSREDKDILDEIRQERYDRIHNPKGGKQLEEKQFLDKAPAETAPKSEGNTSKVRRQEIAASIVAASNQTVR